MSNEADADRTLIADYWSTAISDIGPGRIAFRGYPIEDMIGKVSFAAMIWLMLRGELPTEEQERLLEAALVASVDHGPHAPSIAIARMSVSCGLPLNNAIASAVNSLGDVHGGAGEQALELYHAVIAECDRGTDIDSAAASVIETLTSAGGRYLPGFGHRFHPIDPRTRPLLELVEANVGSGGISGKFRRAALAMESVLRSRKQRLIPINIDGATAVIYGELGFAPALARGAFCLSRSVGILAHAWEQVARGERNKGPIPRSLPYRYSGPGRRSLPL